MKSETVTAGFAGNRIVTENSDLARDLFNKGRFGVILSSKKVALSLIEACYLAEKGRLVVVDGKKKAIEAESLISKIAKKDKNFETKYAVFRDIRDRGYIIKTALKFGADFRVYDRGVKPGEDHAKWVVFPVHESERFTWYEFAAKNRVAHSTKKKLLMAVVDDEGDVSYWEIRWLRP